MHLWILICFLASRRKWIANTSSGKCFLLGVIDENFSSELTGPSVNPFLDKGMNDNKKMYYDELKAPLPDH